MRQHSIWTLALLTIGVVVLFGGVVNPAYTDTAEPVQVTNETATVNYSNPSELSVPDYATNVSDNETVYNASGATLVEGTDYQFHTSNHSVVWFNTTNTTAGNDASVTYNYSAPPQQSRHIKGVVGAFDHVIGGMLLLAGVSAAFLYASSRNTW